MKPSIENIPRPLENLYGLNFSSIPYSPGAIVKRLSAALEIETKDRAPSYLLKLIETLNNYGKNVSEMDVEMNKNTAATNPVTTILGTSEGANQVALNLAKEFGHYAASTDGIFIINAGTDIGRDFRIGYRAATIHESATGNPIEGYASALDANSLMVCVGTIAELEEAKKFTSPKGASVALNKKESYLVVQDHEKIECMSTASDILIPIGGGHRTKLTLGLAQKRDALILSTRTRGVSNGAELGPISVDELNRPSVRYAFRVPVEEGRITEFPEDIGFDLQKSEQYIRDSAGISDDQEWKEYLDGLDNPNYGLPEGQKANNPSQVTVMLIHHMLEDIRFPRSA